MKELAKQFKKRGFDYTQVEANQYGYIYSFWDGHITRYEAFERKENTQFDCISFPGDEAFGTWAYACPTLETAQHKLKQIEKRVKNRINEQH